MLERFKPSRKLSRTLGVFAWFSLFSGIVFGGALLYILMQGCLFNGGEISGWGTANRAAYGFTVCKDGTMIVFPGRGGFYD